MSGRKIALNRPLSAPNDQDHHIAPVAPLTIQQKTILAARDWPRFGLETVIHIAEAWQADHGCEEIAQALGLPFRSVCMTLGPIKQCGVELRPRKPPPRRAAEPGEGGSVDQDSWIADLELDSAPVSRGCRWPTNTWPEGEGWRATFCGKPKLEVGFYCEHHRTKSMTTAAQAAEDRKRAAIARSGMMSTRGRLAAHL